MSNIGYAVFGMPKGIAVISNGLFKSLSLDKSLYLNSAHVVLEKGEQALMIRRIPSNLSNLEQKDALLIALYENALQHGENRPGGFVGSAICFKDNMPNAEEVISGLVYLFSKMKENVDVDSRFKAIDAANWNVSLPDANKKYGLEDSKLNYAPSSTVSKNIVIKLNRLDKEAVSLLYNFALNRSFHSVDYLYASTSNSVVDKFKSNGFLQTPLAELFNYNRYLKFFNDRLAKDDEKLKFINKNADDLQKKISIDENEANRLINTITNSKKELDRIDKDIIDAKNQLAQELNKRKELSRNPNIQNPRIVSNKRSLSNEEVNKYESLKRTINKASNTIQENTFYNDNESSNSNSDKLNEDIVARYFEELPKRKSKNKMVRIGLYSLLLILFLTFLTLFILKTRELNNYIGDTERKEQIVREEKAEIETANRKSKEFLNMLAKFQKGSVTADHREFKKLADELLENFTNDKYERSSDEYLFIVDHKWEFWEFDYTNNELVNRLMPNSKPYFISLNYEVKQPISPYLIWNGVDEIDELLKSYLKENNDIYENLNSEVLKDSSIIKTHFTWLICQENGKIDDLKKGQKIKLPFLNIK